MSREIQQRTMMSFKKTHYEETLDKLKQVLPQKVDAEHYARLCVLYIRNDSKLCSATPESIISSIISAAELRLVPSKLSGQAYFVPRYNSASRSMTCNFEIGYKGLITLVRRSEELLTIDARAVYEGDFFDYEFGTNSYLKHKFGPDYRKDGDEGIRFVYATALLKNGHTQFEVMSKEAINEEGRKWSQSYKGPNDSSPWTKHYVAMAKKTVLKRLCVLLPLEDRIHEQLVLEDMAEVGAKMPNIIPTRSVEGDLVFDDTVSENEITEQKQLTEGE